MHNGKHLSANPVPSRSEDRFMKRKIMRGQCGRIRCLHRPMFATDLGYAPVPDAVVQQELTTLGTVKVS